MYRSGWGRYPHIDAQVLRLRRERDLPALLAPGSERQSLIARGLGRSYGDSSLADTIIEMPQLDRFHSFDEESGLLCCAAGCSLAEILSLMAPGGWFLPVVPGTRQVTVGGAIASDVHGKNHHVDGCFSQHVAFIDLCLASGETRRCSPTEEPALFHATCGGMGLTGIILSAGIRLRRTGSELIAQKTAVAADLKQIFELFERNEQSTYSVAWLDCMASGKKLGRSLLFTGEHVEDGHPHGQPPGRGGKKIAGPGLKVPVDMPAFLLNRYSIGLFNQLYYRLSSGVSSQLPYGKFFFPLDNIADWNRLYGKNGFVQYQFLIPGDGAYEGISRALKEVTAAGKGSFLSVLKKFGPGNANLLSFPAAGYTLALDFRMEPGLLPMLERLDQIVTDFGGRLYLAKDARMSRETFRKSYPRWEEFVQLREETGARQAFNSLQSRRLGL